MPNYYLPWLPGGTPTVDLVQATGGPCGMTGPEWALCKAIVDHVQQGRTGLTCDARLVAAAQHKAQRFRALQQCGHTIEGVAANRNVSHFYPLPDFYDLDANYVESYACGPTSPEEALTAWLNSPGHRRHILAEISWYRAQTLCGIGTAPSQTRNDIWVFISAHPPE